METLGEAFPKEQARVREVLENYKAIGQSGMFGAAMIELTLKKADQAVMNDDAVAMLQVYEELKGIKD